MRCKKISDKPGRILGKFFVFWILLYRKVISPWLGCQCRFVPTCSRFAVEVIKEFGPFRGLALTVWRLLRCHPFSRGGYDPPDKYRRKNIL
ncbi:MAG: membrane protein insertion efficiency factor YidD [Planctomycetes bacterium]|nr:membrane protein insertion efficiency factor YidD [Planctomycetota bacterium]